MSDGQADRILAPGEVFIPPRLAGMGTRLAAQVLDLLILCSSLLALTLVLTAAWVPGPFLPYICSTASVAYFAIAEGVRGRTVGKMILGLRVLHADGSALDAQGSVLRNLGRLLWIPPLPGAIVEAAVLLADPHRRRLGDLLAGTVVVRDRNPQLSRALLLRYTYREQPVHPLEVLEQIALTPSEYEALRVFCFRTRTISPRRRDELATKLLAPLYERGGIPQPKGIAQEELLIDLLHFEGQTFGRRAPGIITPPAGRE